ncbi:amidohydrolase [Clostridiaceae bacterium M8S5]|nr:amidohydrolase [Clostridiaceae bacterium M8S5]
MILIKNGKIYTMENGILDGASILIKNGKIAEIGYDIKTNGDVEIIDAKGKLVMPGFIDAHTHLGITESSIGFEGSDHNERTDPITPHLRAIDAINPNDIAFKEAVEKGITCTATGPGSANVIGGEFVAIKTYGNIIDDMVVKKSVGMKCAFGENPKRVYNEKGKMPITRMGIAGLLREALFKAKDYKNRIEATKGDYSKRPAFDMKNEALLKVLNKEIPLKVHAHRADDILTAMRIADEFDVDLTLEHCTEGHLIAKRIKNANLDAIVGPIMTHRSKFELANRSFITPKVLSENGVKVALMTDHPVIPLHLLPVCASLAVKAGLDEMEALKALTINPAEILKIDDRVGSIKIGKDADIAIWDGNPLEISSEVIYTIIDGQIVYKKCQ